MKNITVNFSLCKNQLDLHKELKEKLNFPEWYGNNLDALWDMLTGFIETPANITVVWKPTNEDKNIKEAVLQIIDLFIEASEENEEIKVFCEI